MNTYLFELAKEFKIKRIINPISNCSYPRDVYDNFKEEEWWNGALEESVLTYGFIRKASYVQSWAYHRQYGLETINLIVPNMYGPDDHFQEVRSHAMGAQIMKITEAYINKNPEVIVWGTGKPVREWLYVDDCVEAMIRSIDLPFTNEPINVGVGKGISVWEMVTAIKKAVGYEGELVLDTTKPDGAPYKVMDAAKFRRLFSYFRFTTLDEGIQKTVDYYKKQKGYL
jgi:GDP-L-fucose synthase